MQNKRLGVENKRVGVESEGVENKCAPGEISPPSRTLFEDARALVFAVAFSVFLFFLFFLCINPKGGQHF